MKMISSNKVPFIVLFIFSCLATLLYTGIGWSGKSLEKSISGYCEERKMYDVSVTSPIGITQAGIDRLLTLDGVDEAEGSRLAYGFFESHGKRFSAKVMSLTERIAVSSVEYGILPKNADEIAVEAKWARKNGVSIGDSISVDIENEALACNTFTVTALVENPVYLYTTTIERMVDTSVPVETILFLHPEAFRNTLISGYEQVYLRSNELRQFEFFSQEYSSAAKNLKEKVGTDALCFVQTSAETVDFSFLHEITELCDRTHYSMSFPFVLVCVLISGAVILRLTSESAEQIGLQLAQGSTKNQIMFTYFMFSLFPVMAGSALGTVLGCYIAEPLLVGSIAEIWVIEKMVFVYDFKEAFCLIIVLTMLMNISVLVSCRYVLKRRILSLINGPDVPVLKTAFYEKSKLWQRLSLLTKSILNNIRTDRMRVAVTLAGIIGCTMLSISGLYMLRSVKAGFTRQFENLQSFETVIHFDAESDAEKRILKTLSENGMTSLPVYMETAFLHAPDGKMIPSCVMVSDKELNGWMNFYTEQGEAVRYSEEVLLSRPYADYYDIHDGSMVTFTVNGTGKYDVEIDKVFDYYLACQQLILSAENYRKLTGRTVENNAVLLAKNDVSVSETDALLRAIDGYYCVEDYKSDRYTDYEAYLNVAAGMAGMLIVLSISMALFMLLNLFVQYVNEKKREIITMKINGYSISYVQRYIYVDTIILGVIGVVIGAILGNLLGVIDVNTLYSGISYFPQSIDVVSCLEGMGISAVFTAVMCLRALRQISKFGVLDLYKA